MHAFTVTIQAFCLLCFSICLSTSASPTSTTPQPVNQKDACSFWQRFTEQMNQVYKVHSFIRYNCTYDRTLCNGASCSGSIRYQLLELIEANFCFGLRVNHCQNPVSMSISYMDLNRTDVSFNETIMHNDRRELKSLKMDFKDVGTIQPYLFFNLTKPVPHHVLFGVQVKMRLTTSFGFETWPERFQQDVIPNTEIPVPTCDSKSKKDQPLLPLTCTSSPVLLTTKSPVINSPTYKKPCDMSIFRSCGENEMCKEGDNSTAICECNERHPFNSTTGRCAGTYHPYDPIWTLSPTAMPHVIVHTTSPQKQSQHTQEQSSIDKTKLIGGVVAGVVVLTIIIVVAIVLIRRHRNNNQYLGHLLLSDDDTDNAI